MRGVFSIVLCLGVGSVALGQTAPKRITLKERVLEIDRCQIVTMPKEVPQGVIDVRDLLNSKEPVVLSKTSKVQIGASRVTLSERFPRNEKNSRVSVWGEVTIHQTPNKKGSNHAIGTEICYLEMSPTVGLQPVVGIYRLADDAPIRLEGEPAEFVSGMVRLHPMRILDQNSEFKEEFAVPLSTVAKMLENDPEVGGLFRAEEGTAKLVGSHGLEMRSLAKVLDDGNRIQLAPFDYLLTQIVEREELKGIAIDAGKPRLIVDGDSVNVEFATDEMVVIHLTSAQERQGGNPLLLIISNETTKREDQGTNSRN